MGEVMPERRRRLRALLAERHLDAVIVQKPENVCYLSGFTGGEGLLVVPAMGEENFLITDFRYVEQAAREAPQFTVVRATGPSSDALVSLAERYGWQRLGLEEDYVTIGWFKQLERRLPQRAWDGVYLDGMRSVKDACEIERLRRAVAIADAAFAHVVTILRPGISEKAVAAELEYAMRRQGAEKPAFDTIVASGARGSLPHGLATDKLLAEGELVTMDFGAVYAGYHSDITRTVVLGRASERQRQVYAAVLTAQRRGAAAVKPGLTGRQVDAVARDCLTAAGYGEYFGHALGHGVGLAIHEEPRLSATYDGVLATGMVVSVEPGVYLPGWGGVRIEDLVVLTPDGCEVLTGSTKELLEIDSH